MLPPRLCVLERCARKLGLSSEQQSAAELILGTEPVPHLPISRWPGFELGKVNELQLVLQTLRAP
eukprot:396284-Amphidinium_carterae.1